MGLSHDSDRAPYSALVKKLKLFVGSVSWAVPIKERVGELFIFKLLVIRLVTMKNLSGIP